MRNKPLISVIAVALIIALAMALNPSPEKHREKIRQAIAERSPLAGALGLGALAAFVSSYHSLGVASYTVVNDRTATVGAFGIVFVMSNA
jgi:heme O synthase-like polyprenyltransferase